MSYSKATSTQENYRGEIKTAEQWRKFIAAGRSKTERKTANNTYVRFLKNSEIVAIKLHDTDIVLIMPNGNMVLNSGGWLSVTTKERINRYTNAGISQRGGVWYMGDGSLFYDGMAIKPDGTPVKPRATEQYEKKLKAIKKQAKTYAKKYVEALQAGLIDYPSGGDCWACLLRGPKSDESFKGSDHIREHIKQNYFVPSLLVNAGRAAGYRDDQIGLMGIGGHRVFIEPERVLYRYIVKQLQAAL